MSRKVLAVLAVGAAMLLMTTAANATVSAIGDSAVPATFDLTANGSLDWFTVDSSAALIEKSGGGGLVVAFNDSMTNHPSGTGTTVSYTDGPGGIGSSTGYAGGGSQWGGFTITAAGTDPGVYNTVNLLLAETHSDGGEISKPLAVYQDGSLQQVTAAGGQSWHLYTFTYTGDAVTMYYPYNPAQGGNMGAYDTRPYFQAVTLGAPTPEPATMCLLVIGGIGALLRRRRAAA